jgi:drug/metabolite transporter (DMT)-like permease
MDSYLGLGAALASSFTWAVGVSAFTPLSRRYPAYVINLHRILLALPTFFLILIFRGSLVSSFAAVTQHQVLWATIAVLASYAFGDALFLMSTKRLGAPAALAIASTYPVWSALGARIFQGEVLAASKYLGIGIVILGTIFVILSGAKKETSSLAPARKFAYLGGVLLAFSCAFCWALNTVAVKEMGQGLDAVMVNAFRLAIALVLCPLIGVSMNGLKSFRMIPRRDFLPILPIFAIEAIAGPFLYVYGLSHSPLAIGAALTALAPVISVPIAVVLGQEKFSLPKTLGVSAVVVGVWVMLF